MSNQSSDLSWAIDLFDDSLSDDAVVTDAIAIVAFAVMPDEDEDDNGVRYSFQMDSDSPLSMAIGLLELVKGALVREAQRDDGK